MKNGIFPRNFNIFSTSRERSIFVVYQTLQHLQHSSRKKNYSPQESRFWGKSNISAEKDMLWSDFPFSAIAIYLPTNLPIYLYVYIYIFFFFFSLSLSVSLSPFIHTSFLDPYRSPSCSIHGCVRANTHTTTHEGGQSHRQTAELLTVNFPTT